MSFTGSIAQGVGNLTATPTFAFPSSPSVSLTPPPAISLDTLTSDPDYIAFMIRHRTSCSPDGIVCSQHTPPHIIPQRGQIPENNSQPPSSEHW